MLAHPDMVYVPVPTLLYADVIGLIAERLGAQEGLTAVAPAEMPETPEPIKPDLDEALVRRIYGESLDTHRRLLEVLASHAGEWVSYADISKEMGFDNPRSLPGTMGALSRRVNHRYGGRWAFEAEPLSGDWHARMEPWVAEIIVELGETR